MRHVSDASHADWDAMGTPAEGKRALSVTISSNSILHPIKYAWHEEFAVLSAHEEGLTELICMPRYRGKNVAHRIGAVHKLHARKPKNGAADQRT